MTNLERRLKVHRRRQALKMALQNSLKKIITFDFRSLCAYSFFNLSGQGYAKNMTKLQRRLLMHHRRRKRKLLLKRSLNKSAVFITTSAFMCYLSNFPATASYFTNQAQSAPIVFNIETPELQFSSVALAGEADNFHCLLGEEWLTVFVEVQGNKEFGSLSVITAELKYGDLTVGAFRGEVQGNEQGGCLIALKFDRASILAIRDMGGNMMVTLEGMLDEVPFSRTGFLNIMEEESEEKIFEFDDETTREEAGQTKEDSGSEEEEVEEQANACNSQEGSEDPGDFPNTCNANGDDNESEGALEDTRGIAFKDMEENSAKSEQDGGDEEIWLEQAADMLSGLPVLIEEKEENEENGRGQNTGAENGSSTLKKESKDEGTDDDIWLEQAADMLSGLPVLIDDCGETESVNM